MLVMHRVKRGIGGCAKRTVMQTMKAMLSRNHYAAEVKCGAEATALSHVARTVRKCHEQTFDFRGRIWKGRRERDAGSLKMVEVSPSLFGLEQSRSYDNVPLRRPLRLISDNMKNS